MEKKYRLELIGITYNQIESGVYALILQQVGSSRRIPIIIGFPEAQAIECKLQSVNPPRPLTHDTMTTVLAEFGIELSYVEIKKLPNGVFAADMVFTDGSATKVVDARSSDAVALAIRADAPIYTSETVLREAGFDPDKKKDGKEKADSSQTPDESGQASSSGFEGMSLKMLAKEMQHAAEMEDYEKAASIKAEIDKRNAQNDQQ